MPEQTPPATDTKPDAQQPPAEERAKLEKLTKSELVDLVQLSLAEAAETRDALARTRDALVQHRDQGRARPEDAMVVTALLDLHRTVGAEARQGSTIRGRKAESIAPRYLEAARTLGDELVTAILGPNAKV